MDLQCKKCGRAWDYTGQKIFYTSCPDCKTSVKIIKEETKEVVE